MRWISRLFGRAEADARDINQLIFDIAEHSYPSDKQELYRRFHFMEVYTKVYETNVKLPNGGKHVVKKGDRIIIETARLPGGQCVALFFVDKSDPRLLPEFIGMTVPEACAMVLRIDDIDGMMLCNLNDSWFAMMKDEIKRVARGWIRFSKNLE
jgi:hypothetical protein